MDSVWRLGDLMLGAKFIAPIMTKIVDVGLIVSLVSGVPQKTLAIMPNRFGAQLITVQTTKV